MVNIGLYPHLKFFFPQNFYDKHFHKIAQVLKFFGQVNGERQLRFRYLLESLRVFFKRMRDEFVAFVKLGKVHYLGPYKLRDEFRLFNFILRYFFRISLKEEAPVLLRNGLIH